MQVKIYYHHTDAGGVVYYARYLDFLEEARTAFMAERGVSVAELAEAGTLFVVARQEIDYNSPAFYADTLTITTSLEKLGAASLGFNCQISNQQNKLICRAKTVLVCVKRIKSEFKPAAMPEDVRKKLYETPRGR